MQFASRRSCAFAAALAITLAACSRPAHETASRAAPAEPARAAPPPPAPTVLGRPDLIDAARRAAEAFATGARYPDQLPSLIGARFEARLPFGCFGADPTATLGYSVDPARATLTLRAAPVVWTDTPWVLELLGPNRPEAIEGFWLHRPWLTADRCPMSRAGQALVVAAPESLGLVRMFAPGESRVLQHGARGYEVVQKAEPGRLRLAGFRLVLAGRVSDFGGRQPIRCRSDSPELRPVCLIAVQFDRVAFEDPMTGEVLAEWSS